MLPHNRLYLHRDFLQKLLPLQNTLSSSLDCTDDLILCCGKILLSQPGLYLKCSALRALWTDFEHSVVVFEASHAIRSVANH